MSLYQQIKQGTCPCNNRSSSVRVPVTTDQVAYVSCNNRSSSVLVPVTTDQAAYVSLYQQIKQRTCPVTTDQAAYVSLRSTLHRESGKKQIECIPKRSLRYVMRGLRAVYRARSTMVLGLPKTSTRQFHRVVAPFLLVLVFG